MLTVIIVVLLVLALLGFFGNGFGNAAYVNTGRNGGISLFGIVVVLILLRVFGVI